jgi:CRP-like cAMP-binding protein
VVAPQTALASLLRLASLTGQPVTSGHPGSHPKLMRPSSPELFANLDSRTAATVRAALPVREWVPGQALLTAGQTNERMHLIETGEVEVWRGEIGQPDALLIATLAAGEIVGEMSAFENRTAKATVIAKTAVTTRTFTPADLPETDGLRGEVITNLARHLVRRLINTNDHLVTKHEAEQATQRQLLASLMLVGRILVTVSLYVFLLPIAEQLKAVLPSDSLISFGFIIFLTGMTWAFQRASQLPRSAYGLDFTDWPRQIWRGVFWSLPILLGVVLVKWGWLQFHPHSGHLFEPERAMSATQEMAWGMWFLFLVIYGVLSFAQEYVRAVTQGGLSFFYRTAGQADRWKALLIANIVFAILHVHLSPVFAVLAFSGGLLWGWIFQREKSYLAAAVSHLVIGIWVVFIVGVAY